MHNRGRGVSLESVSSSPRSSPPRSPPLSPPPSAPPSPPPSPPTSHSPPLPTSSLQPQLRNQSVRPQRDTASQACPMQRGNIHRDWSSLERAQWSDCPDCNGSLEPMCVRQSTQTSCNAVMCTNHNVVCHEPPDNQPRRKCERDIACWCSMPLHQGSSHAVVAQTRNDPPYVEPTLQLALRPDLFARPLATAGLKITPKNGMGGAAARNSTHPRQREDTFLGPCRTPEDALERATPTA